MIKVLFGNKGIGKTKFLLADVNEAVKTSKGDIVFIDSGNSLMTDLRHEIRYINVSEFPIRTLCGLFGFICGLIAEDFDIEIVYLDGLEKFDTSGSTEFFEKIQQIKEKFNVKFVFSVNGDIKDIPDFVSKEYTC